MKKLYITFTLILSSFFLFNYNVKADTYNYTLNESDFDYLNDIFYKARNFATEYVNNNDCYYFIHKPNANYYIDFFKTVNVYESSFVPDSRVVFRITPQNGECLYRYIYKDDGFQLLFTICDYTTFQFYFSNGILSYSNFLDSNYDFYLKNNIINFSYKDRNYIFDSTNSLPSLYEIYSNENSSQEEDIHKQEKEALSNFYSLIFEKIDLLANSILSNYIYLTIIVIFILIFLIELIRRYLL